MEQSRLQGAAPATIEAALAALKAASQARHLLEQGTDEYAAALDEELRLSARIFELVRDTRVRGGG